MGSLFIAAIDLEREPFEPFEPLAESSCDELFLVCTVLVLFPNCRKNRNSSLKASINGI